MRLLLGLILVPMAACVITTILLGLLWVINPHSFDLFRTSPIWNDGVATGIITFCIYAAPTMVVLLPIVDRLWPLGMGSGAVLAAVGGVTTVLLSIPLNPAFEGFDLAGQSLTLALLVAGIGGGAAGLVFVACRRGLQTLRRG